MVEEEGEFHVRVCLLTNYVDQDSKDVHIAQSVGVWRVNPGQLCSLSGGVSSFLMSLDISEQGDDGHWLSGKGMIVVYSLTSPFISFIQ